MSVEPGDGDGFEDLPPLDDEWISKAGKREESAADRADRLRRIAAGHERIQREQASDRQAAAVKYRRDRWRPFIIGGAIIAAILVVFFIL